MKNNKLTLALASIVALTAASAATAASNEVYLGVGTTGVGGGYSYGINDRFAVRGEYAGLGYSGTYDNSGSQYKGRLHLQNVGVYGDWFPFAGTFRVTAGYVNTNNHFDGEADGGTGTVTINHVKYPLAGESAKVNIKFPKNVPYLGIGWGHAPSHAGWGVYGDIGLQFGNPTTRITLSSGLAAQVPPGDVKAQEDSINHDVKVLGGYPVLAFGVSYRF
ncbi:hypothetical protein RKE25_23300 (plasmid) [Dyella sp. BiH032]|uniref:hypothetical protein n=1 Tax=Dyella sp. BiH032 TaxID=3075430 RepID=UPI0028936FF6|nr:hypothetical protein [Dyella sp. BiH032]WNL48543.1 hypothetical protein RKE25_23300 [Dyella sp. BiH032]